MYENTKIISINDLKLIFPVENKIYAAQFCMYDRWPTFLANTAQDGIIIDIGANVGDTVAWMYPSTKADFYCIEPDDKFYALLQHNISNFPEELSKRIKIKKAFISNEPNKNHLLNSHDGTGHMIEVSEKTETPSMTLVQALKSDNISIDKVRIIKVDTDGYDWQCIMSLGDEALEVASPILYWENQINDENTYNGFLRLNNYLNQYKYDHFFIFDNFGNFMSYGGHDFYVDTNKYLMRMLKYNTGRTAYYFDVVACKFEQVPSIQKAVKMYLNNYPI